MEQLVEYLVPILAGLLGGWISATVTARAKLRELEASFRLDERRKNAEERAKNQLNYLNPLRVAAIDLRDRLNNVKQRIQESDTLLPDTVSEVSSRAKDDEESFADWANGLGQYALSSMHLICIYLARASRIRTELPFVQLSSRGDQELLNRLSEVRESLGGDFGIWESLQDSLGDYIRNVDGTLMDYREFCLQLENAGTAHWFRRLVDFLRDLHMKTSAERQAAIDSLRDLIDFLTQQPLQTAYEGVPHDGRARYAWRTAIFRGRRPHLHRPPPAGDGEMTIPRLTEDKG
jgi:hypothetical protein